MAVKAALKINLPKLVAYLSCSAGCTLFEETNALDVGLLRYGNMSGVVVPGDVQMQFRERGKNSGHLPFL